MKKLDPNSIHDRVEYVRDLFMFTDKHPTAYELFIFPLAAYDSDGIMIRANKRFRYFTGITEDDIQNKSVNIFDYLNKDNKGLVSAAKNAFHDEEVIVQNLVCPLRPYTEAAEIELSMFRDAVFFPIINDAEWITVCGVLIMRESKADDG